MDKTIKLFLSYIFSVILFALIILLFIFYFYLYGSAIEREKLMLLAVVNSNSKLIEAVAKFDAKFSQTDDPEGAEGATLSQINDFVTQFSKGNANYSIQIYKVIGSDIKLLSFSTITKNNFTENWYIQNNKLLKSVMEGSSGTRIVEDDLNNDLILAYSKINGLDFGMLISVNLKEIREPYIRALYIGIVLCIVLSLFFGYIIRKKAQPVIDKLNSEIEEKTNALETLKKNEENLKVTLNSIGEAVLTTDINGNITRMNPVAEKLTGWNISEAIGKKLTDVFKIVHANTREIVANPVEKVITTGEIVGLANHTLLISRNGKEYQIADSGAPIKTEDGPILGVVLVFRDMTNDYMLQLQLRHSQKMDAVGQLANGVAHDFNNMLGGILMSAGLLNKYIGDKPEAQRPINIIHESAKHAASLTQKLLTFSRKDNKPTTFIDIHKVIQDTASLLETTIDKRITLTLSLNSEKTCVLGDHSQLQSCILNLGINASHAMPNGGKILFSTKSLHLDAEFCSKNVFGIKPGLYAQLEVIDTGSGISPENISKIFEPFFTTKPVGQGTGLGLSTVYGTIQQHQGSISVSSIVNEGTTFQILLPIFEEKLSLSKANKDYIPKKSNGLILFADDEMAFRETVKESLEDLGYKVMTAINGQDALEIYEKNYYKIDLVILDMMMPVMNGLDCFIALKKINPKVRAILATGFIKDNDLEKIKSEGIIDFLKKPYTNTELFQKIEAVIYAS